MTNQEVNIAIAEACGWKQVEPKQCGHHKVDYAFEKDGAYYGGINAIPNYCNDLNAMHEAEKVLIIMPEKRITYGHLLMDATCKNWAAFHATARQRAEAFLKTLNLWKS